jgi:lipopolysaccharide transport system permease protein
MSTSLGNGGSTRFLHIRDLLRELVRRDMKLKYKRSALGVGWSLLNPLAQLFVYRFVFEQVLPAGVPNFSAYLFMGILAWNWFQASLMMATTSVVDNRDLIKRPGVPVAILPSVTIVTHLIHFLLALVIFAAVLFGNGISIHMSIVALPAIIVIQFLLTLGLAYLLSTAHVLFRDVQYLLGVALLLLFFLSPIFYEASSIPPQYLTLYHLNPIVGLLDSYRAVLLHGEFPNPDTLFSMALASVILVGVGHFLFKRASHHFVEEL